MSKIKVAIVDDHQIVRDGIKSLLHNEPGIEIVSEAKCGDTIDEMINESQPEVILMDISLPGKSGIELCNYVMKEYENIKVLILSMYMNEEFILNAIKAGAKGYLPKNTSKPELLDAIKAVYNGEEYYNENISQMILKSYVKNIKQEQESQEITETLSKRELEILKLFAEGQTNQEIADSLFISIRTVESHKSHIMQKLNLKSSVDLVKYALKNKIVEL
ncbi:MAG: DNA-binding response regulator [Salinivirgaceae bacterium]|nr:MAG: DNA-binding response regulator [Salinivirgaceae bacterium]